MAPSTATTTTTAVTTIHVRRLGPVVLGAGPTYDCVVGQGALLGCVGGDTSAGTGPAEGESGWVVSDHVTPFHQRSASAPVGSGYHPAGGRLEGVGSVTGRR